MDDLWDIIRAAKRLPRAKQDIVVYNLLHADGEDATVEYSELTPTQRKDLQRRIAEYEDGNADFLSRDEVLDKLRSRHGSEFAK
jgi:Putative addiction module component